MTLRRWTPGIAACAAWALPLSAAAHHAMDNALPRNFFEGFVSGLAHPVIGLDHFLFVAAMGAAGYFFGRGVGTVLTFVAAAVGGTVIHLSQATLAFPDAWVAATLILLGVLLFAGGGLLKWKGALAVFALAGLAHGYAYGEAIVGAEATPLYAYLAGFTLVQVAIAIVGFALARHAEKRKPAFRTASAVGAALSVAGVGFLALSFV